MLGVPARVAQTGSLRCFGSAAVDEAVRVGGRLRFGEEVVGEAQQTASLLYCSLVRVSPEMSVPARVAQTGSLRCFGSAAVDETMRTGSQLR
jgi:hypothetical protein